MRSYLLVNANKFEIVIIFYILFTFRERTISLKSVKLQFEFETLFIVFDFSFVFSFSIYLFNCLLCITSRLQFPLFLLLPISPRAIPPPFPIRKEFCFLNIHLLCMISVSFENHNDSLHTD